VIERDAAGRWTLSDQSRNGIFYLDAQGQMQRLVPRQPVPLSEGARFMINREWFEFHSPAHTEAAPEAPRSESPVASARAVVSLPIRFNPQGIFALTHHHLPGDPRLQSFHVEIQVHEGNRWFLVGRNSSETISFFNPQTQAWEPIRPDASYPVTAGTRFILGDPANPQRRWIASIGAEGNLAIMRPDEPGVNPPLSSRAPEGRPVAAAPSRDRNPLEELERPHPVFEGRTAEGATRLILDEIAYSWARLRYPKSRKKRAAEAYLHHRLGSLRA
jgi:hypothetical protein